MGIVCRACGQTSKGAEFCDHCNRDLNEPTSPVSLPGRCPGTVLGIELTPEQHDVLSRPEASILLHADGAWQRVHWIGSDILPLWSARLRERVAKSNLRALPRARFMEEDTGAWLSVEALPPLSPEAGQEEIGPWTARLEDMQDECERLVRYLGRLAQSMEELHAEDMICATFHPIGLEQGQASDDASPVRFTNLDLGVFHPGQCPEPASISAHFAAPEISQGAAEDIGPRADVFHLALFAYYWLAGLLPDGFPGDGLDAMAYQAPKLRVYAPRLPPGVAAVLARGMKMDPAARYATPGELAAALADAVAANRQRLEHKGTLRWDIGGDTRAGRAKLALARDNEDRVLIVPFSGPERALVVVADGITTCDVGSGALASLIVAIVLENIFDPASSQASFPERIAAACEQGARTLLAWAQEKGYATQLEEGADLMGTTLTAAWLEGNTLSVANLGDSRAYLIDETNVEQLTVDGDLASGMLASGVPPESIRSVGPLAKALRECIGGCTVDEEGAITILHECCNPQVTSWRLVPGDIVVLCSDGLVEEGAFLEPETLGEMVRANRHLSAQDLARYLADAAEGLQRLPTPLEPEGFGDNISCIVVKVEGGG